MSRHNQGDLFRPFIVAGAVWEPRERKGARSGPIRIVEVLEGNRMVIVQPLKEGSSPRGLATKTLVYSYIPRDYQAPKVVTEQEKLLARLDDLERRVDALETQKRLKLEGA